jgi:hypothetical protein
MFEWIYEIFRNYFHPTSTIQAPYFFQITGGEISATKPVYVLGIHTLLKTSEIPSEVISRIESCDMLIYSPPTLNTSTLKQEFGEFIRLMQKQFDVPDVTYLQKTMTTLYFPEDYQAVLLQELPKRSQEYKVWGPLWIGQLPTSVRQRIETFLAEYGLKLEELHPMLVEAVLRHRISLPKEETFAEVVIRHFRENQKKVHVIENLVRFASMFESITAEWEDPFDVKSSLRALTVMAARQGSLQTELQFDYNQYAAGEKPLNVKLIKESSHDEIGIIPEQMQWIDTIRPLLTSNHSTAIVVPYEILEGPVGLLSCLELARYTVVIP